MVWARGRRRWTPGGREAKTSARSRRGAGDSRKAATGERPWAPTEPHPTAPGAVLTGRERDYVPRGLGLGPAGAAGRLGRGRPRRVHVCALRPRRRKSALAKSS